MSISNKTRNWLQKFIEWGGLAGVICYLLNGEFQNALLLTIALGIFVIGFGKFFSK